MIKSKEQILDKEHWDYVEKVGLSSIHSKTFPEAYKQQAMIAMDEYARSQSVAFIEYNDKFRREEGRWFRRECEKVGGVFSLADYGVENIYDDFVARKPIRSYLIPDQETFWVFNENGKLIHSSEQKNHNHDHKR